MPRGYRNSDGRPIAWGETRTRPRYVAKEDCHPLMQLIDRIRVEQGMSSEALSAELGYSRNWWVLTLRQRGWEKTINRIERVLDVLGYELSIKRVANESGEDKC